MAHVNILLSDQNSGLLLARFSGRHQDSRDTRDHRVEMIGEEMIGPWHDVDLDLHTLLDRQAFDQLVDRVRRHGGVVLAMDDQAGGRAGRKKREIMGCRRRRCRDETANFRAAHHQRMPIQDPNEKPAIQHWFDAGFCDCSQSMAVAASDSSPSPLS